MTDKELGLRADRMLDAVFRRLLQRMSSEEAHAIMAMIYWAVRDYSASMEAQSNQWMKMALDGVAQAENRFLDTVCGRLPDAMYPPGTK